MKKYILIVLAVCLILPSSLWAQKPIQLLTGEVSPYVSKALEGYGFLTEIVTLTFKEMGLKAQYKFYPWKRCEFLVKGGEAWATFPYSYTEKRAEEFHFSDIIGYSTTRFFYYKNIGTLHYETIEDLKQYKLGGVSGYFYEERFKKAGLRVSYSRNELIAMKKLIAGRVDFLPINEVVGWELIRKNFPQEIIKGFGTLEKPLSQDPLRLMVSKAYPDSQSLLNHFNTTFKKVKKTPAYNTILNKYSLACYQGLESATKSGFKKYNDDNKDAVIYIGFNVNPHPYC